MDSTAEGNHYERHVKQTKKENARLSRALEKWAPEKRTSRRV
jgi:hypothetical protein